MQTGAIGVNPDSRVTLGVLATLMEDILPTTAPAEPVQPHAEGPLSTGGELIGTADSLVATRTEVLVTHQGHHLRLVQLNSVGALLARHRTDLTWRQDHSAPFKVGHVHRSGVVPGITEPHRPMVTDGSQTSTIVHLFAIVEHLKGITGMSDGNVDPLVTTDVLMWVTTIIPSTTSTRANVQSSPVRVQPHGGSTVMVMTTLVEDVLPATTPAMTVKPELEKKTKEN